MPNVYISQVMEEKSLPVLINKNDIRASLNATKPKKLPHFEKHK